MRSQRSGWLSFVGAAALLVVLSTPAHAVFALTLDDLVSGMSFGTSSGLAFDGFTASLTGGLSTTNLTQYPVEVLPAGFRVTGPLSLSSDVGDLLVSYNVTLTPSAQAAGQAIDAATLVFDATVGAPGTSASVAEDQFSGPGGVLLGSLFVAVTGGGTDIRSDRVTFSPAVTALHVLKDVQLDALVGGGTGNASIALVEQAFSVVPEPTTLALLGLGLLGLVTFTARTQPRS